MRHPQASFEAQPRIARLLAPKIGIYPYTETGSAYVCAAAFCKNQLHVREAIYLDAMLDLF